MNSGKENPFRVTPSYDFWAPWIGERMRGSSIFNTEVKKHPVLLNQSRSVEDIAVDGDRLTELLSNASVCIRFQQGVIFIVLKIHTFFSFRKQSYTIRIDKELNEFTRSICLSTYMIYFIKPNLCFIFNTVYFVIKPDYILLNLSMLHDFTESSCSGCRQICRHTRKRNV